MASSLKSYLSAVRQLQIQAGFPDPEIGRMPRLQQILKGIKTTRGQEGRATQRKRPITANIMRQLKSVMDKNDTMLWAACNVAFFGFLRTGEFTVPSVGSYDPKVHLNMGDVSANHPSNPDVIHIKLKKSKTDPCYQGRVVVLGKSGEDLCPIRALLDYLRKRGMKSGPLFIQEKGHPLTKTNFVSRVKEKLERLGYNSGDYSGHSFRAGAATTAAKAGVEDSIIKALGRWESSAYLLYVRLRPEDLRGMARRMAREHKDSKERQ
ncbi:PREDICTED: uncharacterized protein LOC100640846 [Amphimedon queenslandica]|uniref:Tyr recombinase domain-containing protein n=1 Tax=Amphimedon queenslandica TaxID=400682 RepID=A0A1X7TV50_AMPQE|nr:PREDICTED: uncharacterized protein LOC100640846 [Amphimedon queenslandica]|eukprot:XP_003389721.1 PREDICTED: uncharacterized protein LOC100640846 [Amphimedon queenslandica]